MAERGGLTIPDRLQVFVSSTIAECAVEREAARLAISGLNFEPVLFEREGARAEPPREFYLRKLQAAHLVVAFYRASYGWVDAAKGMTISGLEDEYREAVRLGKDFLAYVLKTPSDRDDRLSALLEDLKAGPHTLYFYGEDEDLEARIRDDVTALVSDRYARFQDTRTAAAASADGLLASIFKGSPYRIRRAALLDGLSRTATLSRIVWVEGAPGAGKTALAAEWAHERQAAFVNAKGLDPRTVLSEAARALSLASEAELAAPLFEDLRSLLIARWANGRHWPLVIDDPDDVRSVWSVLGDCLATSGAGSVVIAVRAAAEGLPGERYPVAAFSPEEAALLQSISDGALADLGGALPISVRRRAGSGAIRDAFETLDPLGRELLGYVALSPAPLSLEDLVKLVGSAISGGDAAEKLNALSDMIMEGASGFSMVHDAYRDDLVADLETRPQLKALLSNRLSKQLAATGRAWAAFTLQRTFGEATERLANQAMREAVFTGSTLHLVDALEYLCALYRSTDQPGALISVLMALAEARSHQGRSAEGAVLLEEALGLATRLEDLDALNAIEIQQAGLALRRSASPEALARVRALGRQARERGQDGDLGRLLLEEATALLGANETEAAIPVYREAREVFERIGDAYGVEIAIRNLVVSLSVLPDGLAESERLRGELGASAVQTPRHRAWLCNLLVPRLRREGRLDEAEAMAREAIGIGESLSDLNLVATNQVVLGNVMRAARRFADALEAYAIAGRMASTLGRPDLEGRCSRLSALVENEAASETEGTERSGHAERAELFATHAAGIFSATFAWSEYAYALEERGDAKRTLERRNEASLDYGDAVGAYLKAGAEGEAARLLRNVMALLDDDPRLVEVIGRAFGATADPARGQSGAWLASLAGALDHCPRSAAPQVLGALVRVFYPAADGDWWFAAFVRCLLELEPRPEAGETSKLGPWLLLAVLGYSPHRAFKTPQLLGLAALCLGQGGRAFIRHRPNGDLNQILCLGGSDEVLVTIRDEAVRPEATFVALCIGAFLDAFGKEVSDILFGGGLDEGIAIDVTVLAGADASGETAVEIAQGLIDTPVAVARFTPPEDEAAEGEPLIVLVREDAVACLKADPERGGELELLLARVLNEVIHRTSGSTLDDEIYASKVRDLLLSVFG
jgi:tetratricopeptide (TPR) repeat protein